MSESFVNIFLSHLENAGVQYAVIRGWEDLPERMNGGDLDMWVAPADYEQMRQVAHQALVQTNGYVVSYLDNMMAPRYCFLAHD